MDKLEFDARLAYLERRVALLSALILGGLAVVGLLAMIATARTEVSANRPAIISSPAPTAPAAFAAPMRAVADFSEGSVGHLANQLRDLADLNRRSLLTSSEYEEKKKQLLEKPLRSSDLKAELEFISELQKQHIVTDDEFRAIKRKILAIGK